VPGGLAWGYACLVVNGIMGNRGGEKGISGRSGWLHRVAGLVVGELQIVSE